MMWPPGASDSTFYTPTTAPSYPPGSSHSHLLRAPETHRDASAEGPLLSVLVLPGWLLQQIFAWLAPPFLQVLDKNTTSQANPFLVALPKIMVFHLTLHYFLYLVLSFNHHMKYYICLYVCLLSEIPPKTYKWTDSRNPELTLLCLPLSLQCSGQYYMSGRLSVNSLMMA